MWIIKVFWAGLYCIKDWDKYKSSNIDGLFHFSSNFEHFWAKNYYYQKC